MDLITKIDPHVHSLASNQPFDHTMTKRLGILDCYNDPEHIYAVAKQRGMDYVTITDHNRICEALKLASKYDDVIVGCEFDVNVSAFPQPFGKPIDELVPVIHTIVLGLDKSQFTQLNQLRYEGLDVFVHYLQMQQLTYYWAHPAYSEHPQASMTPALMEGIIKHFGAVATRNGQMRKENKLVKILASIHNKAEVGESDSHYYNTIGLTWTGTAGKVSKEELLERFRIGEIFAGGKQGTFKREKNVFLGVKDDYIAAELSWLRQGSRWQNLIKDPFKYLGLNLVQKKAPRILLNRVLNFESRLHWMNEWNRIRKLEKAYMDFNNGKYKEEFRILLPKIKRLEKQNPDGIYDLDNDIKFTLAEELAFGLYLVITSFWKRDY